VVLTEQGLHWRGDTSHCPHALLDCYTRCTDGCDDYEYGYYDDGGDVHGDFGYPDCYCHCDRENKHNYDYVEWE
jgi:hypothetical protein